jgi:hypothetical protein
MLIITLLFSLLLYVCVCVDGTTSDDGCDMDTSSFEVGLHLQFFWCLVFELLCENFFKHTIQVSGSTPLQSVAWCFKYFNFLKCFLQCVHVICSSEDWLTFEELLLTFEELLLTFEELLVISKDDELTFKDCLSFATLLSFVVLIVE